MRFSARGFDACEQRAAGLVETVEKAYCDAEFDAAPKSSALNMFNGVQMGVVEANFPSGR